MNKLIMMNKTIVFATVILTLAACGIKNKNNKDAKADVQEFKVGVIETACEPMEINISSGKTRFLITNKTDRALEWEILNGSRVVAEREGIPPGFTQKLTVNLDPGSYDMTCGYLSNPKGKIIVKLAEGADANRKPTPVEIVTASGEYKVYTNSEMRALLKGAQALKEAIAKNDLKAAQALYAPTYQHYERIEPFLKQFADLSNMIAANEYVYQAGVNDTKFSGFHKLEYGLFKEKSTAGLAVVADKLVIDIETLQKEAKETQVKGNQLLAFSADILANIEQTNLEGKESLYAQTDLWGIQARIEGSHRIFRLLRHMLDITHPEMKDKIENEYTQLDTLLSKYKEGEGFKPYSKLSSEDKVTLKTLIIKLSENLTQLPEILGIN